MQRRDEKNGGRLGPKRAEEKKPGYYFCSLSVNWNHKILDRFRERSTVLLLRRLLLLPFAAHRLFVGSLIPRLGWLQSAEVGCNYRLPITNLTRVVTIRFETYSRIGAINSYSNCSSHFQYT